MNSGRSVGDALLIVIFLSLLFPVDAHAYLDPGTGSLLVQSVIAGLAAVGYAVRLNWHRLQQWFVRGNRSKSDGSR